MRRVRSLAGNWGSDLSGARTPGGGRSMPVCRRARWWSAVAGCGVAAAAVAILVPISGAGAARGTDGCSAATHETGWMRHGHQPGHGSRSACKLTSPAASGAPTPATASMTSVPASRTTLVVVPGPATQAPRPTQPGAPPATPGAGSLDLATDPPRSAGDRLVLPGAMLAFGVCVAGLVALAGRRGRRSRGTS